MLKRGILLRSLFQNTIQNVYSKAFSLQLPRPAYTIVHTYAQFFGHSAILLRFAASANNVRRHRHVKKSATCTEVRDWRRRTSSRKRCSQKPVVVVSSSRSSGLWSSRSSPVSRSSLARDQLFVVLLAHIDSRCRSARRSIY